MASVKSLRERKQKFQIFFSQMSLELVVLQESYNEGFCGDGRMSVTNAVSGSLK